MRALALNHTIFLPRPPGPHLILQLFLQHLHHILTDNGQELPAMKGGPRCEVEVRAVRVRGDERVLGGRDGVPEEFGIR